MGAFVALQQMHRCPEEQMPSYSKRSAEDKSKAQCDLLAQLLRRF